MRSWTLPSKVEKKFNNQLPLEHGGITRSSNDIKVLSLLKQLSNLWCEFLIQKE